MRKIRNPARKEQVLKRKNFFPSLLATFALWMLLAAFIYFVDPNSFGAIYIFLSLFFLATLFTCSIILGGTRRGVLASSGLAFFLILRYFGIGNILNVLLIAGVVVVIELYYLKR